MHFVVINSSPRNPSQSNTSTILSAFLKGIDQSGATKEVYCLANKKDKQKVINAFLSNKNIIFALPLYTETIPSIMMEFLQELSQEIKNSDSIMDRKISFILQSAFPEACQRRCCENFLKSLPEKLNSSFAGILSHGDTFNLSFVESTKMGVLASFEFLAKKFVENGGTFFFDEAIEFTGQEYFSEAEAKKFNRLLKFFCQHIAEAKGCTASLVYDPYKDNNE